MPIEIAYKILLPLIKPLEDVCLFLYADSAARFFYTDAHAALGWHGLDANGNLPALWGELQRVR